MKQVPAYVICQVVGSTLASGTLRLIFNGHQTQIVVSAPSGSDLQSFVVEFITTFYLMFVISGVATDNRAVMFFLPFLKRGTNIICPLFFASSPDLCGYWDDDDQLKSA